MHAIDLIVLAANLAFRGPELIERKGHWSQHGLNDYWCYSKLRLDRWYGDLKSYAETFQRDRQWQCSQAWPLLEEVLASEVLTRVWAAVATARDRTQKNSDAEPLVKSILIGHMEARNRVLRLVLYAPGVAAENAVQINRLRSQAERWTDLLIGSLLDLADVSDFAVDAQRARDFGDDFDRSDTPEVGTMWSTLITSIQHGFTETLKSSAAQAELNEQIYNSIQTCVGDARWLTPNQPADNAWMERIDDTAETTEQLIMLLEADFYGRIGGAC